MTTLPTVSKKGQYIEDLARAGFALIPLLPNSKHPFNHDWVDLPPDPFLRETDFPDGYGVVLRDDLLVLDVDPRNFKPNDQPLERLVDALGGQRFDTFTVQTGGGGLHIYFRKPEGLKLKMTVGAYPGIECKSYGHQVVGPGSIHPDTKKSYEVVHGTPYRLIYAPKELFRIFERASRELEDGLSEYQDDDGTRQRFITFLATAPVAIQGQGGDTTTFKTASMGREFGLSEQATLELMREHWNDRCSPAWDEKGLATKVSNAYAYSQNKAGNRHPATDFSVTHWEEDRQKAEEISRIVWDLGPRGDLYKDTVRNVMNHFEVRDYQGYRNPLLKLVRFNSFSHRIEFNHPAPWHLAGNASTHWTKDDDTEFRAYLSQAKGWSPSKDLIRDGVFSYSRQHSYHPLRQYLTCLKWDGVKRLDSLFCHYTGALDCEYTRDIAIRFGVSAIARVMKPGCQSDHMVVLEGKQGTGKSTFCRILGGQYHREIHIDAKDKDSKLALFGKWICEIPEMVCIRKADVDSLKAFISNPVDNVRKPYGTDVEDIPRQCIFIGTHNPGRDGTYLQDTTGNRRFWPIETTKILLAELEQDRDQIWAEAFQLYKAGEPWHIVNEEILRNAEEEQAKRLQKEVWGEVILNWILRKRHGGERVDELRSEFIATEVLNVPVRYHNNGTYSRIACAMQEIGWESIRIYTNGRQIRGYRDPVALLDLEQLLDGV